MCKGGDEGESAERMRLGGTGGHKGTTACEKHTNIQEGGRGVAGHVIYPNNQTGPMIRSIVILRFLILEPPLFLVPNCPQTANDAFYRTAHKLRTMHFSPPLFHRVVSS